MKTYGPGQDDEDGMIVFKGQRIKLRDFLFDHERYPFIFSIDDIFESWRKSE